MSNPDPAGALATYLMAELPDLEGLISRPELPSSDDPGMPSRRAVIRLAGGYQLTGVSNQPVGDPVLDIFSYGATWMDASALAASLIPPLRRLRGGVWRDTRLYWARIAGGPNPYQDPTTNWPCVVLSVQLMHSEIATA